ncbi:hypothetical protein ACFQT0_15395 [Hymenobacter humi]|uniref:Uncharacterized protein n=1 Tax=Hymenobacter humi TaxID=1411620 RepID=A0ABW2U8E7_9BACT
MAVAAVVLGRHRLVALGPGAGLRAADWCRCGKELPPKLDAEFMNGLSRLVTNQLWANPSQAWLTLTKAVTVIPMGSYDAVYQNMSNTWIFVKLLAVLNLGSLGLGWLNGLYLSLFAFVGCWRLVRCLADVLPRTPAGAGVVAFLLWPSVWFWATSISKEAVLLGSGAWLTAQVLGKLYGKPVAEKQSGWQSAGWWLGTAVLALLHFQMRYFLRCRCWEYSAGWR